MTKRDRPCAVEGCNRAVTAREFCSTHYSKLWRSGSLEQKRVSPGTLQKWIEQNAGRRERECLIWPFSRCNAGYGFAKYNGTRMGAHRAMCVAAHGPPPFAGAHAAHRCGKGDAGCVNPSCLYWATAKQNCADKIAHGTAQIGTANAAAILTPEQVALIIADQRRNAVVAKSFGVSPRTIAAIRNGKNWKSVSGGKKNQAEGNRCVGKDHPRVRMTEQEVVEIFRDARSERQIAADFECSRSLVNSIKTGRAWGHLTGAARRNYPYERAA